MSRANFSDSAFVNAAKSSGVLAIGSAPNWPRRSSVSGRFTTRAISCWMRATISLGVPLGAYIPYHA